MLGAHIGDWERERKLLFVVLRHYWLAMLPSVTSAIKMLKSLPPTGNTFVGSYRHLLTAQYSSLMMAMHFLADLFNPFLATA